MSARVAEVSRLLYRHTGHGHAAFSANMTKRVREDKVHISTQSVDFKTPHSAKTKQAWRYPGGKIVRAPSVRLGSADYYDPKHPNERLPRRQQESNFFITINSNKAPVQTEHVKAVVDGMKRVMEQLANESVLATYLKFGPKSEAYHDDKYADVVRSVSWKAAVETGDKMRRVHAHVWLTVSHYSQIQINVQMLMYLTRLYYNAAVPNVGTLSMQDMPYVHVKLLPQAEWTDIMRQYIHKGMMAGNEE